MEGLKICQSLFSYFAQTFKDHCETEQYHGHTTKGTTFCKMMLNVYAMNNHFLLFQVSITLQS